LADIKALFAADGALAQAVRDYQPRPGQQELAEARPRKVWGGGRLGGGWALCFKRAFSTSVALGLVTVSITLGWEVKLLSFNRIVGNLPVQCFCFAQEVTLFILRIYPLTVAFKGLHRMLV